MNALQNPNPNQSANPRPYPNSNWVPNPNIAPSSSSSLTFDQVSNFFSLPLSDAADSLGVCPAVLKKICYDNGLVRWPYRKVLAGKSLEEIKEDAAREKSKHLNELPAAVGQANDDIASPILALPLFRLIHGRELPCKTTTSLLLVILLGKVCLAVSKAAITTFSFALKSQEAAKGFPLQNKTSSVQELTKPQIVMQQQGIKNAQTGSPKLHGSLLTKGIPSNLDEFKYGFPSDGLSSVFYRWWGESSATGKTSTAGNGPEEIQDKTKSPPKLVDSDVLSLVNGGDKCEKLTEKAVIDSSGTGSITALRKIAVKEGQEALKLGVRRRHGIKKLDQSKKMVLLQIFKSSLPSGWRD